MNYYFLSQENSQRSVLLAPLMPSESFSLVLCVEAMYNLCAGRILECPFVFPLIQVKTTFIGQTNHYIMTFKTGREGFSLCGHRA